MLTSSDLYGAKVRDPDGRIIGRVHEIHIRDGDVRSLTVGAKGLLQRFTASRMGKRIPWDAVSSIDGGVVVLSRVPKSRRSRTR